MIRGIEVFKKSFEGYKDQYVLIGGAACDIAMEETGNGFRATKDLDIVLIVEALTPEFGKAFWNFIRAGGYRNKSRSTGKPQFYRFDKPEVPGYPYMLELFSKSPFEIGMEEQVLAPMHIDDEVSSLSAILLNDVYYQMLLDGKIEVEGLMILSPVFIIPFKAKAWLDLTDKKNKGISVDEKDIRKHKNDIARLVVVVDGNAPIALPREVKEDMGLFLSQYEKEPADLKNLGLGNFTNAEIIRRIKDIYQLP